jgi:L-asparaginase II
LNRAQILVEVTRGPLVENVHRGHVAVVDWQGNLLYSVGDPGHITYWRSSAKPFQALPIVESGAADRYGIEPKELALFCASHSGEKIHTDTVLGIFKKIGQDPSLLQCGVHMPYHAETARAMTQAGEKPSALHCNCSGKHSGMLTLVTHLGYDPANYLELDHPLQQLILDYVAEFTGYPREQIAIGTDGCGVPVHGLPLYNMALAYARLAHPQGNPSRIEACRRMTAAMIAHPEMVGGTDRFCTDLMRTAGGVLVGKAGAAGVYCVGIMEEGIGIAVKCEDGSSRGRDPVVVEILKQLGFLSAQQVQSLEKYHRPRNVNHRQEKCGEVIPALQLRKEAGN